MAGARHVEDGVDLRGVNSLSPLSLTKHSPSA
jgi:hypothetical protein